MATLTNKGKSKAPPSTEPIVTRLHVSGLAPSVQAQDIVDRFASFGQVQGGVEGVDGLQVNANGDRKGSAFVNLHTTTHQLNKCTHQRKLCDSLDLSLYSYRHLTGISLLSGSLWKGHKLRIAPAKADYTKRLESERAIAAAVSAGLIPDPYLKKKKKKRRNPDPNVGYEAAHFELVNPGNIDRHKGWTLDTTVPSAPIALFPLIVRPSHPIFPLAKPAPTSWTRETPKARQAREARIQAALERPVLRSKRMRIDPRKWGRRRVVFDRDHEVGEGFGVGVGTAGMRGYWECEEEEGREGEVGGEVTWVYKAPDGSVRRRETISLGAARFTQRTDRFTALLEGLNRPSGVATVGPAHEGEGSVQEDEASPESDGEDDPDSLSKRTTERLKSLSPPPYVPVAPRSLLYNEEDAFALLSTTREEDELREGRRLEKEAQLKVLKRLVEVEKEMAREDTEKEVVEVQAVEVKKLPKVEGFADDDDDDWDEVMRLRGGAKSSSDEEHDSSDDDDDSSDEEEEMTAAPAASTSTKPVVEEKTTLKRGMLKEMFKPKEAEASFSMLDGLDLELEELERTPSPPPPSHTFNAGSSTSTPYQNRNTFFAPPALGRSNRAWVGTAPTTPFFTFPSGAFEVRGTGEIDEKEVLKSGLTMERAEELKKESDRNLAEGANKFWAYESPEEFEALHQELRDKLRGFARKRHREAVKKQGKSGRKGPTPLF
ncbi:BQ2448_3198 [Microbotryum intermedium]|uniref:BQ2448_3198 protein n=1 Tax=Microbotryum intermedium TaxID=269621 RepID=A0A238FCP9_9BASI|nr:BQ2448_3198 [Microbotryum intermedium]